MYAKSSDGSVLVGRFQSSDGRASIAPDSRVQPCTVEPLRVNEAPALFASYHERRKRRSVMEACKRAESARRASVKHALSALSAILPPSDASFDKSDYRTMADALEALYASYRQAAREAASLMSRAPHDGRPPMAVKVASTVGAMEVRHSDRWQSSPAKPSDCRSLHTVPMQRGELVNAAHEWNAAVDRGCTVTVFAAAPTDSRKRSRSGKVAPTVKRRKVTAADLPPVFAD